MHELVLGRYRLDERLLLSATAETWLAIDTTTGQRVVVKRLRPDLIGDERAVQRFRAEVAATSAVRHPSLVRLLDAGPFEMVLEHVPGETLASRVARGPLPPTDVTHIGADVAAALAALHAAGLLHRDVSPGNVLLDVSGRAHLADLGNAIADGSPDGLAGSGWVVGTQRYVAPEVMAGGQATAASDVWALGATLSDAVAGLGGERPAPEAAGEPLGLLLTRMVDPDPAARPSAAGVASALAPAPMAATELLAVTPRPDAPPAPPGRRAPGPAAVAPGSPAWGGVARPSPARRDSSPGAGRSATLARRTAIAVAGVLVAAGATLAAAGPVEPPAAADGGPVGPLSLPSSSAPAPAAAPSTNQGSFAAHRTGHALPPRRQHGHKRGRRGGRTGGHGGEHGRGGGGHHGGGRGGGGQHG